MLAHPTEQRLVALGLSSMAKALEQQRLLLDAAALSFRAALKDKPLGRPNWPTLTAARRGGVCSAVRIKPQSDRSSSQVDQRGG